MAQQFGDDTILGKILAQPGGIDLLQKLGPVLGGSIKAETQAKQSSAIRDRYKEMPDQDYSTPESGLPQQPGIGDISARTPEEQAQYQQPAEELRGIPGMPKGGMEGAEGPASPIQQMKSPKPHEIEAAEEEVVRTPAGTFSASEFIETPFGRYHPQMVQELRASPNPTDQREAQAIDNYLLQNEKLEGKEGVEQRKEWRGEIKEFSKPFQDLTKLDSQVKKLEKARELILSGKTNLDENWVRRAVMSVLEDANAPQKAELLKTEEDRILYSMIYDSLRTKDLGGSNPSTREVLLSLAAKPSPYKGMKANLAVIDDMMRLALENQAKGKAINEIRDRAGPISFPRFQVEVSERANEILGPEEERAQREQMRMEAAMSIRGQKPKKGFAFVMNKKTGVVHQVPLSQVKAAEDADGEYIRGK